MNKSLILLICFFNVIVFFSSCKQEYQCEKMIYEISKEDQNKILERLELENFEKIIVIVNIDHSTESIDFQSIHGENNLLNDFYYKTNRFLKLSEDTLVPAISSEDFALIKTKHLYDTTGCGFRYQLNLF